MILSVSSFSGILFFSSFFILFCPLHNNMIWLILYPQNETFFFFWINMRSKSRWLDDVHIWKGHLVQTVVKKYKSLFIIHTQTHTPETRFLRRIISQQWKAWKESERETRWKIKNHISCCRQTIADGLYSSRSLLPQFTLKNVFI